MLSKSTVLRKARKTLRQVNHSLFYGNSPIILVNSFQKSGTHMITEAVSASSKFKYYGRGVYNHTITRMWIDKWKHKNTSPETAIAKFDKTIYSGEIVRGHLEYSDRLSNYFSQRKIKHVLVLRNPLAVLLSLANWWERYEEIDVIPYHLFKQAETEADKWKLLLHGVYQGEKVWLNLVERFRLYEGWLKDPTCLVVRYESIVNNHNEFYEQLSEHFKLDFDKNKFIEGLNKRDNKTYSKAEDKKYKSLPDWIYADYETIGGATLNKDFGF